jgi:transposase
VLSDFCKNNLSFFRDAFKQSVKMAIKLEMGSLGHISLDGSKFKANSSKHKALSYGRLKAKERKLNSYSVCTNIEQNIYQFAIG